MTDLNQISQEEKQNRLLDALSYVPFLFILNTLQNGKNEGAMWHAKMGALATAIFMIPVFVAAFVSVFFGGMLYGFFFLYIGLSAYKAWNADKLDIPALSKIATKIPLELILKKTAKPVVEVPTSSQIVTTASAEAIKVPATPVAPIAPVAPAAPITTTQPTNTNQTT